MVHGPTVAANIVLQRFFVYALAHVWTKYNPKIFSNGWREVLVQVDSVPGATTPPLVQHIYNELTSITNVSCLLLKTFHKFHLMLKYKMGYDRYAKK